MSNTLQHLYPSVSPTHYQLSIIPSADMKLFDGSVVATIELASPTKIVTLHAKDLTVTSATINGSKVQVSYDKANDFVSFTHAAELSGTIELSIDYKGNITRQLQGIYPSTYKDADGATQTMLATQLESHHAREVLPCVDEPSAKATFQLTLRVNDGNVALSNTPITDKQDYKEGGQLVTFDTTPIMSSYLLAFVTGDLRSLETKSTRGVDVAVWATPDKIEQAQFALDVATKCLDYFEDYFAIDYPLAKCDFIALPDFVTGAMENWGCITFRETAMLVDENTSQQGKQWVAEVVAHELAHQWFGNLVTMEWWTDLWLNEGFASWVASLAVDKLFPEWDVWTDFVISDTFRGQDLDALDSSHPIQVTITDPDDIRSIFDAISYSKGGSVLRMLHAHMGAAAFQEGLQYYLKKYAYDNAKTEDLWAALEHTSGKPIKAFMDTWTTKIGFPYVSVAIENDMMTLKQNKFSVSPHAKKSTQIWPVPLFNDTQDSVFDMASTTTSIPEDGALINRGRKGFYYTAYDDKSIATFSEKIADESLSPLDRLGLLQEAAELNKAGKQSMSALLELIRAYRNESNARVWNVISGAIGDIRRVFNDDEITDLLKQQLLPIVQKQAQAAGMTPQDDEDHNTTLMRPIALGLASWAGDQSVIDECTKLFENPDEIHADIKSVVYSTVARNGDMTTFDTLWDMHNATSSGQEKTKLAAAMTSFSQPEINKKMVGLITSDNIRSQDVYYWMAYAFSNQKAKHITWDWLNAEWDWVKESFEGDIATFAYIPKFAAAPFSDRTFLETYKAFFAEKDAKGISLQIEQGIETIEWQAAWNERDAQELKQWLNNKSLAK